MWRVSDREGNTVLESETATVSGTVVDSLEAGPVEGARVRAADGGGDVVTAGAGTFFLPGLPPGLAVLEVSHPYLDALRLGPVAARADATAGEVASLRVRLPGVRELLDEACSGAPQGDRESAPVLGLVTRDGQPAEGERVRVRWMGANMEDFQVAARAAPPLRDGAVSEWIEDPEDGRWLETHLDHRGIFLVCGVPTRTQLRVEAGAASASAATTVTVLPGTRVLVVPLSLGGAGDP